MCPSAGVLASRVRGKWREGSLSVNPVETDRPPLPKAGPGPPPHTAAQHPSRSNRNGPKCWFSKKPVSSSSGKLPAWHGPSQQEPRRPPEAADREPRTQPLVEMRPHQPPLLKSSESPPSSADGESACSYRLPRKIHARLHRPPGVSPCRG